MRAILLSALCSLAAASLFSLAKHADGVLLLRVDANGTMVPIGAPIGNASLAPTQGLSTLDSTAHVLYTILANEDAANKPFLFGVSLATGAVVATVPLPLVNGDSIGAGQVLGLVRASGDVIVGGSNAAGDVAFYIVTPAAGAVRMVAKINATELQISPSCSHVAHDPAANAIFFGGIRNSDYARLVLRIELSTGSLKRISNPEDHRIYGYGYDEVTGNVVGLGSHGASEETIIAQLSTTNFTVSSIGAIPAYPYSASGLEALDAARGTLTWVGGASVDAPFSLIVNELAAGAPVASAAEVCKTFESCNLLTLDFDGSL